MPWHLRRASVIVQLVILMDVGGTLDMSWLGPWPPGGVPWEEWPAPRVMQLAYDGLRESVAKLPSALSRRPHARPHAPHAERRQLFYVNVCPDQDPVETVSVIDHPTTTHTTTTSTTSTTRTFTNTTTTTPSLMQNALQRLVSEVVKDIKLLIFDLAWLLSRWLLIGWMTSALMGFVVGGVGWLLARMQMEDSGEDRQRFRCSRACSSYPKASGACGCLNGTACLLLLVFLGLVTYSGIKVFTELNMEMLQQSIEGFSQGFGKAMSGVFSASDGRLSLISGGKEIKYPMRNPLDGFLSLSNFDVHAGVGIVQSVHLHLPRPQDFQPLRPLCIDASLRVDAVATVFGVTSATVGALGASIISVTANLVVAGSYNNDDWRLEASVIFPFDPSGLPPPSQLGDSKKLAAGFIRGTALGLERMHKSGDIMLQISSLVLKGPIFTLVWGIVALCWINMLLSSVVWGLCCADCCRKRDDEDDKDALENAVRMARRQMQWRREHERSYSPSAPGFFGGGPGMVYGAPVKVDTLAL